MKLIEQIANVFMSVGKAPLHFSWRLIRYGDVDSSLSRPDLDSAQVNKICSYLFLPIDDLPLKEKKKILNACYSWLRALMFTSDGGRIDAETTVRLQNLTTWVGVISRGGTALKVMKKGSTVVEHLETALSRMGRTYSFASEDDLKRVVNVLLRSQNCR